MSLWQVPDYQTQELMTLFYSSWLEEKMTIPEAFRAAQKEMREKYQNPYFWAGFVLVEWGLFYFSNFKFQIKALEAGTFLLEI